MPSTTATLPREVPHAYICGITQEVMVDPVVDPDGNSYERAAIEAWLAQKAESPITRQPLSAAQLAPNRALKDAIESFQEKALDAGTVLPQTRRDGKPQAQVAVVCPEGAGPGFIIEVPVGDKTVQLEIPDGVDPGDEFIVEVDLEDSPEPRDAEAVATSAVAAGPAGTDVRLELSAVRDGDTVLVRATARPPEGTARTPTDVCMVVDVSGSMGAEATMLNADGAREAHGLSLLDITKHAVATVIETLGAADRFTLVAYSSAVKTPCAAVAMDADGKQLARRQLEALRPAGQTNLWAGLEAGLEALRAATSPERLASLLLLTDGQPNVVPPRGHLPMLRRYWEAHPDFRATVSTFGFGYNLDSALLEKLALAGDGAYCFIPDSGFVGTAFVHAASNMLATAARRAELALELGKGVELVSTACPGLAEAGQPAVEAVCGGQLLERASWGGQLALGALAHGQPRDLLLRLKVPDSFGAGDELLAAALRYETLGQKPGAARREAHAALRLADLAPAAPPAMAVQQLRTALVDALAAARAEMAADDQAAALAVIDSFGARVAAEAERARVRGEAAAAAQLAAMLEDVKGQAAEACQRAAWQRWGRHYLPSLGRAHQLQQCNNFKDPGVQGYGGDVFREVRDLADAAFMRLPAPKPSCLPAAQQTRAAPVDMRMYYNASGGCIAGDCRAQLFQPTGDLQRLKDDFAQAGLGVDSLPPPEGVAAWKRVDDLRAGDVIDDGAGGPAVVQCVVKTLCADRSARLVAFDGGLRITAWHPVMAAGAQGRWSFPADLAAHRADGGGALDRPAGICSGKVGGARLEDAAECAAVYSFVLARPGARGAGPRPAGMLVNGVACIALAHGIEGDAVASHAFYGTEAVARALARHDPVGWAAGHVTLAADAVIRGPPRPGGAGEPGLAATLPAADAMIFASM